MDSQVVRVPLPQWDELALQSSVKALAESTGSGIVTVKPVRFRSRPILISGVIFGGMEGSSIYGWWLVPEADYTAPLPITHVYNDQEAIIAGTRARGDLRGLKVRWSGNILIVQSKIHVHPSLPRAKLGLADAQAEDLKLRRSGGWRVAMTAPREPVGWWLLQGHPVVEYRSIHGQRILTLYYRSNAEIGSMMISAERDLAAQLVEAEPSPQQDLLPAMAPPPRPTVNAQMGFGF